MTGNCHFLGERIDSARASAENALWPFLWKTVGRRSQDADRRGMIRIRHSDRLAPGSCSRGQLGVAGAYFEKGVGVSARKRRSARKPPKHELERRDAIESSLFTDRRAMEQLLREALRDAGTPDHRGTDLAQAVELIFRAYQNDDYQQRLEMVSEAIDLCPHCAEAYVCLAELTPSPEHASTLYRLGLKTAESTLGGEDRIAQYNGRFWAALETRAYMRARFGLALSLWATGQQDEALQHCRKLLQLNPGDNQGVRYLLCSYYCELGRDARLQRLLDAYPEDQSAEWLFARALLDFRREGDVPRARRSLRKAHRNNPHVVQYLLGNRELRPDTSSFVQRGHETEAIAYVNHFISGWRNSPGALTWVRKTLRIEVAGAPATRRPVSLRHLIERVRALPRQADEVWQIEMQRTAITTAGEQGESQPWTLLISCPTTEELLHMEVLASQRPKPREVLALLLEVMLSPGEGRPRRPGRIQVRRKTFLNQWKKRLETLQIRGEWCARLEHYEAMWTWLQKVARFSESSVGDMEARLAEMSELPQEFDEVWQADARRLATWVTEEGVPQRPMGALVASATHNMILAQRVGLDETLGQLLWEAVLAALLSPAVGPPHLPGMIEVTSQEFRELLDHRLGPLGVECRVEPQLDRLDFIYSELESGLSASERMPALIDTPGVCLEQVGGFFDAAANFYRRQPWRQVWGDKPMVIQCDRFQTSRWYGVVMGQSGMTLGLALYEDLDVLRCVLRQEPGADRRHAGLSIMYGEPFEISVRDLDAAEKNHWPIAAPEGYPIIVRMNPGMAIRPPLSWELELAEACLRAIPCFVRREVRTAARMMVPTANGDLDLEVAWLDS